MDFSLSADQRALQDGVSRLLRDICPLPKLRALTGGGSSVAAEVWTGLCDMGVPGILVPEARGGLGLTLLDAALVSEALGAAAAPSPFLGSALATIAVREAGNDDQLAAYLPELASGRLTGAVALSEAFVGARDGAALRALGPAVSGTSLFVIDGASPGVLVAAVEGGLYVMDCAAPGLSWVAMPTIDDTRRLSEVRCDSVAAAAMPGGNAVTQAAAAARVLDAAFVLLAADMLGASQTMLDRAVAYAKERVQFGRPIGSFQAVKHMCAEMAAQLEPCRALVWYAAHAWDEGLADAALAASHAKSHLSEISQFVARTATEVHGGMGFTDLLGLHYWFKRVGLDRQLLGGPVQVRRHAAQLQGF